MWNCINRYSRTSDFRELTNDIVDKLEISDLDKLILKNRFIKIVTQMDISTKYTARLYNILGLFITVGSIIVPALLSVQDKPFASHDINDYEKDVQSHRIFWTTFAIALLVSISNGIIKLFSVDQTYIIRHLRYNDMRREGWLFFQLAGPYKKYKRHSQAIKPFIFNIEKIKTNQLKEEYTPENSDQKEMNTYESVNSLIKNNVGLQVSNDKISSDIEFLDTGISKVEVTITDVDDTTNTTNTTSKKERFSHV